jgi:hypothetical protein
MDLRTATPPSPDPDAVEFVRFCYRRRRVGWPELYDEMCAVANRGLFRGYGCDDLAARGVAFGLFDMPGLAALAARVVEEEKASRRSAQVVIRPAEVVPAGPEAEGHAPVAPAPAPAAVPVRTIRIAEPEVEPTPAFTRMALPASA